MLKITSMIWLSLILFQSSPLLAGANCSVAAADAIGQADTDRVSTHQIYADADGTKEMAACTEPRPQVCTQDYQPVCAVLQDGSLKTYSNGCSACSDPAVTGYREGTCE